MVIGANDGISLEKPTRNSLVFHTFNFILLTDDHSEQLMMLAGNCDGELFDIISINKFNSFIRHSQVIDHNKKQ
jgi:hypothetical protein